MAKRGRKAGGENPLTIKAVQSPTTLDIAWAAGFFEGEGCCRSSEGSTASVQICQKEKEPLERMQRLFGGSLNRYGSRGFWYWGVYGGRGRGFVQTIYPFLSQRRKQQVRNCVQAIFSQAQPMAANAGGGFGPQGADPTAGLQGMAGGFGAGGGF